MQTHSSFSSERKEHETFKMELNTAIPRGRLCWKIWMVPSLPCYQNKAVHYSYNIHVKYTNQTYVFKVFVLIPLTKMFKSIRMCFECFTIYLYICLFIYLLLEMYWWMQPLAQTGNILNTRIRIILCLSILIR